MPARACGVGDRPECLALPELSIGETVVAHDDLVIGAEGSAIEDAAEFQRRAKGPPAYQLTGSLEGRLEAALRNGKVEAVWNSDIKNLSYASPDLPPAGAPAIRLGAETLSTPIAGIRNER